MQGSQLEQVPHVWARYGTYCARAGNSRSGLPSSNHLSFAPDLSYYLYLLVYLLDFQIGKTDIYCRNGERSVRSAELPQGTSTSNSLLPCG